MKLIGTPFWTKEKGPGLWVQKYRDERGTLCKKRVPREVAPTDSIPHGRAAAAWIAVWVTEQAATEMAAPTLAELAVRMLPVWKRDRRLAAKTYEDREGHLRLHLLPVLGPLRPEEITIPVLRAWVREQREAGVSRSAANNRLSTLATLLDDAAAEDFTEKDGSVARHKAVRRELPEAVVSAPKTLAPSALESLLDAPTTPLVWAVRYGLAALAGFEDGVIAGLRMTDYDGRSLSVRRAVAQKGPKGWASVSKTKNPHRGSDEAPRRVPVHPALAVLLEAWFAEGFRVWTGRNPKPANFVLPQPDGRPWRPASAEKLRHHLKLADVAFPESLTLHDLRGAFLTWLAALGVSEEQRKRLAGHAGSVQAEHYLDADALLEADRRAVERIPVKVCRKVCLAKIDRPSRHQNPTKQAPPAGIGPATFGLGNRRRERTAVDRGISSPVQSARTFGSRAAKQGRSRRRGLSNGLSLGRDKHHARRSFHA